ncbi:MAG: rhomboid family intramembrane serine protease [Verrucomicrobiota bacterium]
MLFPLSDDDKDLMSPAWVTIGLIVINIAVFLYQIANPEFQFAYSAIPLEITKGVDLIDPQAIRAGGEMIAIPQAPGPSPIQFTLLSAMFMHGGWMHLAGNMLYLWIFGDNVEHRFGSLKFLAFYLVSGLAASFAHIILAPDSVIPTLGASGAISGVLGAYLVLFPRNRVMAMLFYRVVAIPAVLVLGLWAVMQIFSGFGGLAEIGTKGGVAYAAHVGGFIAGVTAGIIARIFVKHEPPNAFKNIYNRELR